MPEEPKTPDKKLFVDENWKSQVEAEREAARHAAEPPGAPGEGREKPAVPGKTSEKPSHGGEHPLPPVDLTFLIGTLYLQGTMGLGLVPNPITSKPEVQLGQAKHAIDLLAMLEEKTQGNRTPEESEELDAVLHELRMGYLAVSQQT